MPTFTVPNWAALLMAALEVAILVKVCWAIPRQEGRWLRGLPLFVLLGGLLFGFVLLVDYSEWKEGHATQGDARRATAILEFCDYLETESVGLEQRDCNKVIDSLHIRYETLSTDLVAYSGSPLPNFPARPKDCEGQLLELFERCRIAALKVELNPELEHNGSVGLYFGDRLFDQD